MLVLQWPAIGFLVAGVFFGVCLGVIPGLGVIIGLVVLLPFTFGMDPVPAFALLLGMYAVTSTSDTISSVMLGVPGTSASQATILDGHPMAKKGEGARALGAAFTTSAFGGVFGAFVLALSLPLIKPIIQSVGSPEIFMLGLLGLTMVSSVSGNSITKGMAAALLGLLISTIGYSDSGAVPRYYLGIDYFLDGLPLIPVVLGLFALPELIELAIRDTSISRVQGKVPEGKGLIAGMKDVLVHRWLAIRSALIGTYIGMLPGLGASIVDWLAYGHAIQSAKDKSQFGHGDIRGVIAPEAANNATRGGSLVPTLAFGVPGSLGAAILLGALLIVGLKPGPEMLTTQLATTFSMVWSIAIANILATILLLLAAKQVAKIAFVPGHLIVPGAVVFVLMGAWLGGGSLGDWITCIVMGVIGLWMKRSNWPRPPLVLALVLGAILENAFLLTTRAYGPYEWLARPIVLAILLILIVSLIFVVRGLLKRSKTQSIQASEDSSSQFYSSVFSLPLSLLLVTVFSVAGWLAGDWPRSVQQFPLLLAYLGMLLTIFISAREVIAFRSALSSASNLSAMLGSACRSALLPQSCQFFAYLIVMVALMMLLGQKLVLPMFVATYLIRWGHYNWRTALIYAAVTWLTLILFYDRVMHLLWYPSWLSEHLPSWMPVWFFA
jgi:putative tricarboxylic transport membrane protein